MSQIDLKIYNSNENFREIENKCIKLFEIVKNANNQNKVEYN